MLVPQRKNSYAPPELVTGINLLVYMYKVFISHRKHSYRPAQPVAGMALSVYIWSIFVSVKKRTYGLHSLLNKWLYFFICR
jgi:hypothetical protein